MSQENRPKSFDISKHAVFEAYRRVKANKGAAGVDGESIEQFEVDLKANLYKLWNRMSSGCYFPPPLRMVEIPKSGGRGVRILGVPTVADRIAQTVAAMYLEPGGGEDLPPRLLRIPAQPKRAGRGRGVSRAVLGNRLGARSGHQRVLRQPRS
jgi:retron-type reverse transcriptase